MHRELKNPAPPLLLPLRNQCMLVPAANMCYRWRSSGSNRVGAARAGLAASGDNAEM
jgi:hypothetical protein